MCLSTTMYVHISSLTRTCIRPYYVDAVSASIAACGASCEASCRASCEANREAACCAAEPICSATCAPRCGAACYIVQTINRTLSVFKNRWPRCVCKPARTPRSFGLRFQRGRFAKALYMYKPNTWADSISSVGNLSGVLHRRLYVTMCLISLPSWPFLSNVTYIVPLSCLQDYTHFIMPGLVALVRCVQ
jgi:hypothetical protein